MAGRAKYRLRILAIAVALAFAAAAGGLTARTWSLARAADLALVHRSAAELAARSAALAAVAGADYQGRALEKVRASCASRQVTRLDERTPTVVETAATADPEAARKAALLLDLDLRRDGLASVEAVDGDAVALAGARGLELRRGQVRTRGSFALPRDSVGTIEIEARSTAPGYLLLGWTDEADAVRLRRNKARVELLADGRPHTYAIDAGPALTRGLASDASVRRFFLASRSEGEIEVRALRAFSRTQRYADAAWGTSHERRAEERRSVLWAHMDTALAWDVDVPVERPVFETGLGLLAEDGVVEFEVSVESLPPTPASTAMAPSEREILVKKLVKHTEWEDLAIDLKRFAGRRVRLRLAVRGSGDAIALWSSPLLRPLMDESSTEPFLVLLEDALRADRLSVYGGPVPAPAHERIAARGVVFEKAFSQATQTRSSVPSFMTSLLPSANGTWDFSDSLSERHVTMAEVLRACGFATASFLQNGNAGPYAGLAQGFDVVFDEEGFGPRASDLLSEKLDRWIAKQRGRSWFAYVHILDPHGPYDPEGREDLRARLAGSGAAGGHVVERDRAIDASWLTHPTAEARRTLYDAEVATNDAAIGSFLDRLAARGDLARAVVAVIADHGEFLGEHGGLWRHHPPGHVEVTHVPFLLSAPGAAPTRVSAPVALLDLAPTLFELAKIDASGLLLHGESLAATLRGGLPPARAVPGEEMALERGERVTAGCGSFVTDSTLWLNSCTRDDDYEDGAALPSRPASPTPLRWFELDGAGAGKEQTLDPFSRRILGTLVGRDLRALQESGLAAWRRMTDGAAAKIRSEPGSVERLRGLGYLE